MKLEFTKPFVRKYKKLDPQSQKTIKKALVIMENDFSHPSLRVKKMKGYYNPNVWEASANMDLCITFELKKPDIILLRNCGHYDEVLRNP